MSDAPAPAGLRSHFLLDRAETILWMRSLWRVAVALFAVLAVLVAAPAASAADQQITASTGAATFLPSDVTVAIGETVTVNRAAGGFFAHNVHYGDMAPCPGPPTTSAWSCPRTFSAPGNFTFICDLHGPTMQATVHVVSSLPPAPSPGPPAPEPTTRNVPAKRLAHLSPTGSCLDELRLRFKRTAGEEIEEGRVFVNGRRVAVRKGKGLTAPIRVGRLPEGGFTVKLVAETADGDRLVGKRRYRACSEG